MSVDDGLRRGFDRPTLRAWAALDLGPLWVPRAQASADEGVATATAVVQGSQIATGTPAGGTPAVGTPAVGTPAAGALSVGGLAGAPTRHDEATLARVERMDWATLRETVTECRRCGLCENRTQTVFGDGEPTARWMLIGEAPGSEEDRKGVPFVGASGQLLTRMLASIGMQRGRDVFIANVLKCRPPQNRNPQPDEIAACSVYLRRQIELVQPDLLLLAGRFAAQTVLGTDRTIGSLRGRAHRVDVAGRTIPAVCTYHPAYLLHNPDDKRQSWRDLNLALDASREGAQRGTSA